MSNDDEWDRLQAVWTRWLHHLTITAPADRPATANAIEYLYRTLGRGLPNIVWMTGDVQSVTRAETGIPLHHTTWLQHGLMFAFPDLDRLGSLLGYDAQENNFRIERNKLLIFGNSFRLRRERGEFSRRPRWARSLTNMLSQFDAPGLVMAEVVAGRTKSRFPASLLTVADACRAVLAQTFAVVLFERLCIVIDRPTHITLDDEQLLSSTSGPAWISKSGKDDIGPSVTRELYAVNGVVFEQFDPKNTQRLWAKLANGWGLSGPQRMASIEYLGWDKFFSIVPSHLRARIDHHPRYGTLFQIACGLQRFLVVKVTNRTAEPDGTFRDYVIPVDSALRPLPNPRDPHGVLGAPQALTALNAVASTFGMTGEHYAAMLGAES